MRATPALFSLFLLTGCAVGPDYVAPTPDAPADWNNGKAAQHGEDISQWWRQLHDPLLDELIAQAVQNSPDMLSARARLHEVRARYDLADGNLLPSLNAALSASRSKVGSAAPANQFNAGFDASWEIDLFGGLRRAREAADADAGATLANLYNTQVTLAAEVALNYVQWRSLQSRLQIAQDNLAAQRETLQITQWRAQAGLVTSVEVEQARANQQQTLAGIPTLETSLLKAENRIAVLLGQRPGSLHERLSAPAPLPPLPDEIALAIPADTLRQRPDVQAAERKLAAETARIGQQQAASYPSFTLSGNLGWKSYSLATLGGADTLTRSLSSALSQSLFDAGRQSSRIRAQQAVQQQALIAYQQTLLLALEEVENALASYANSHRRRAALQEAMGAARNAALLARQRYEGGLIDFQSVLDTDRTRLASEDSLASAELDERAALIALYKALGGGWDEQSALTPVTEGKQP
ncbi:MAG: efflux transporter outer membrane subunit [Pseudomonadota bacterium]